MKHALLAEQPSSRAESGEQHGRGGGENSRNAQRAPVIGGPVCERLLLVDRMTRQPQCQPGERVRHGRQQGEPGELVAIKLALEFRLVFGL